MDNDKLIDIDLLESIGAVIEKINNDGREIEEAVRRCWKRDLSRVKRAKIVLAVENNSSGKCIGVFELVTANIVRTEDDLDGRVEYHLREAVQSLKNLFVDKYLPKGYDDLRNMHYFGV